MCSDGNSLVNKSEPLFVTNCSVLEQRPRDRESSYFIVRRLLAMNKADDPKIAAAIAEERRQNEEAVERHPVVLQAEWLKQRLMAARWSRSM
jgi:hypothetical protein